MYFSCIFERTQQQQNSHTTSAIRSRCLILGGYFSIEFKILTNILITHMSARMHPPTHSVILPSNRSFIHYDRLIVQFLEQLQRDIKTKKNESVSLFEFLLIGSVLIPPKLAFQYFFEV